MLVPLEKVTDEQIRSAHIIATVDPQTGASRSVYGHWSVPPMRMYPSGPNKLNILEVALDSGDEARFQEFGPRVAKIKYAQKEESIRELAKKHYQLEDGLTRIIRFSGSPSIQEQAAEPIKLLEVNQNTPASGVMPLGFGPAPASGIHFPSVIIEVTPDEFEKIQKKELKLPQGWEYQWGELPKTSGTLPD